MNINKEIDFSKVIVEDGCSKFNEQKNVFDVCSPHALVQLIGYIKFCYNGAPVFFRGQTEDFPNIAPSLLRSERQDKKTKLPLKLYLKSVKIGLNTLTSIYMIQ